MLGGQPVPHYVRLGCGGEQLEVGETVAGGIPDAHPLLLPRQMKLPLAGPGQIPGGHTVQQDLVIDRAGQGLGGRRPDGAPEHPSGGIRLLAGAQQLAIDLDAGPFEARHRQETDAVLCLRFEPQQGPHYQGRHPLSSMVHSMEHTETGAL
ncbi:hypothetical protein D3C76_1166340 [compost metagenome]